MKKSKQIHKFRKKKKVLNYVDEQAMRYQGLNTIPNHSSIIIKAIKTETVSDHKVIWIKLFWVGIYIGPCGYTHIFCKQEILEQELKSS